MQALFSNNQRRQFVPFHNSKINCFFKVFCVGKSKQIKERATKCFRFCPEFNIPAAIITQRNFQIRSINFEAERIILHRSIIVAYLSPRKVFFSLSCINKQNDFIEHVLVYHTLILNNTLRLCIVHLECMVNSNRFSFLLP